MERQETNQSKSLWGMNAATVEHALVGLILLAGLGLRLKYFGLHRFHIDEALYSSWALRIYHKFDLLLNGAWGVDKPPVLMYLQACSYFLFGVSENSARIPNVLAGMASIVLIYKIGLRYFNRSVGITAAFLTAVSPFMIAFSNTAFTDMLMVFWCLLSLYLIGRREWFWGGMVLGTSLATKQFAALYFPLAGLLVWFGNPDREHRVKPLWDFTRGLGLAVMVLLGVTAFSNPPWGFILRPSVDMAQVGHMIRGGYWHRAMAWLEMSQWVLRSGTLNVLYLASLVALGVGWLWRLIWNSSSSEWPSQALLIAFAPGYFLLLILMDFKFFDRYVLAMAPFICLGLACGLSALRQVLAAHASHRLVLGATCGGLLVLAFLGFRSARDLDATMQSGSFYSAHDGIDSVGRFFRSQMGGEPVIFLRNHTGWLYYFYADGIGRIQADFVDARQIQVVLARNPSAPLYAVLDGDHDEVGLGIISEAGLTASPVFKALAGAENRVNYTVFALKKAAPRLGD